MLARGPAPLLLLVVGVVVLPACGGCGERFGTQGVMGAAWFDATLPLPERTPLAVGAGFNVFWQPDSCQLPPCPDIAPDAQLRSQTPTVVSGFDGARWQDDDDGVPCQRDIDCAGGETCVDSVCRGACFNDDDCGADERCDTSLLSCRPDGPSRTHDFVAEAPGVALLALEDGAEIEDFFLVEVARAQRVGVVDAFGSLAFAQGLPQEIAIARGLEASLAAGWLDARGRLLQHHEAMMEVRDDLVRERPDGFSATFADWDGAGPAELFLSGSELGRARLHLGASRDDVLDAELFVNVVEGAAPDFVGVDIIDASDRFAVLRAAPRRDGLHLAGVFVQWDIPNGLSLDPASTMNDTVVRLIVDRSAAPSLAPILVDVEGVEGSITWTQIEASR
jgi:hypothetical protein